MTTLIFILSILLILAIGFIKAYKYYSGIKKSLEFAFEYRKKFYEFSKKYGKTYNSIERKGDLDNQLYIWLTKNVSKIQNNVGDFGIMEYIAPMQKYKFSNYPIILNTIPKFRDGSVENFDINSVDDCLLRYLGYLEEKVKTTEKGLKNPFLWFRIGFQEIISLPLMILNWVGIFSSKTVDKIMANTLYKIFTGIIALVTFLSGIVTIIQGKEQTLELIHKIFGK